MTSSINYSELIRSFPTANKAPSVRGNLRVNRSDFIVDEILGFEPSGQGEHLFIQVKKIDSNTDWVARQLQKKAGLTSKDIGYAGKKDRHSISTQWFSLHLPGKQIEVSQLAGDEYEIVKAVRHNKKLRRGSLQGNRFEVVVRNLSAQIDTRIIEVISRFGVPNYYGVQRFGIDGNNLQKADDLLKGNIRIKNRNKRGLIISSARSLLFNLQLASRIANGSWLKHINGDCLMLNKSQSFFVANDLSEEDELRLKDGDLHVSGLLPGKQATEAQGDAKIMEDNVLTGYSIWLDGLSKLNLESSRRALRIMPEDLMLEQTEDSAKFTFFLPKGCYATSLIRELVDVIDVKVGAGNSEAMIRSSGMNVDLKD